MVRVTTKRAITVLTTVQCISLTFGKQMNPSNESSGFMVRGTARPHIVSIFGTENGGPVNLVED